MLLRLLVLIVLSTKSGVFAGPVLGVDLGGEFVKACVVATGAKFEILLDDHSKRKSPLLVVFGDSEREFGNTAGPRSERKPHLAYSLARSLLGEHIGSPQTQRYLEHVVNRDMETDKSRGTINLVHDREAEVYYSPEELVAMTLEHIRKTAEKHIWKTQKKRPSIDQTVITVPSHFSQKQRRALLDAAKIAGLSASLINENSAAALQYLQQMEHNVNNTQIVAFYNSGATKTEVSIVKYSFYKTKRPTPVGQFEVLAVAHEDQLSGKALDRLLVDRFAEEFTETLRKKKIIKQNQHVRDFPRSMAKLWKVAQKTKEVLNSNKERTVRIEGLYDDIDFAYKITKEEFHKMAAGIFDQTLKPLNKALKIAGLEADDVDELVLVGGGTLVKVIQNRLKKRIGEDRISQKINADEAPVLGATLRACNISGSFILRPMGMIDISPYPVGIRLADLPGSSANNILGSLKKPFTKRATLFNRNNKLGKRKSVGFQHDRDIYVTMHYDKPALLPAGTSTVLGSYTLTGLTEFAKNHSEMGRPDISLQFELSSSGIADLLRATASVFHEVEVKVPIKQNTTKTTKSPTTKSKAHAKRKDRKAKQKAANKTSEDDEKTTDDSEKPEEDPEVDEESEAGEDPEEEPEKPKFEMKMVKREIKINLNIERNPPKDVKWMNEDQLDASREKLRVLSERDQATQDKAEALNSVEAYVYKARGGLDVDEITEVTTSEDLESFKNVLAETEDWLYENDDGRTEATYTDRLAALKSKGTPIFLRLSELTELPEAIKGGKKAIELWEQTLDLLTVMKHIPDKDRENLKKKIDKFDSWLNDMTEAQKAAPKTEPFVLFSSEIIRKKITPIKAYANQLLKRPVPPPPETKTKPKNKKTGDAEGENNTTEGETSDGEPEESESASPDSSTEGEDSDDDEPVKDEL